MTALVIERTNFGFVVREPKGAVRAGQFANKWRAEEWQTRLEREDEAGKRQRPCLCCRATFESEGPHNRLCKDCRRRSDDGPYGLVITQQPRARKAMRS